MINDTDSFAAQYAEKMAQLEALWNTGQGESDEAEVLREQMDKLWLKGEIQACATQRKGKVMPKKSKLAELTKDKEALEKQIARATEAHAKLSTRLNEKLAKVNAKIAALPPADSV